MNYDQPLKFLTTLYPHKSWQFRRMEGKFFFFDNIVLDEEKGGEEQEDYEQVYIVNKNGNWEILVNYDKKYTSPYKQPYDLADHLQDFSNDTVGVLNSVGIDQYSYRYFGSKSQKYINQFKNKEEHFLQIVQDGFDCSLPKGNRSTYELSKEIDFDKMTLEMHNHHENLLLNYFNYMAHHVCVLLSNCEENMYESIVSVNCNDSIIDMLSVLDKIKTANQKVGYAVKLNPQFLVNVKSNIEDMKNELNHEDLTTLENKQANAVLKNIMNEIKLYK